MYILPIKIHFIIIIIIINSEPTNLSVEIASSDWSVMIMIMHLYKVVQLLSLGRHSQSKTLYLLSICKIICSIHINREREREEERERGRKREREVAMSLVQSL